MIEDNENSTPTQCVSSALLRRLPNYYNYLRNLHEAGETYVSSAKLAQDMFLNAVQVRKDLAQLSSLPGKSRLGFDIAVLLSDIETFLGYDYCSDAVLIGAGSLGMALLAHNGFADCGLNIVAAFDVRKSVQGKTVNDKPVFPMGKMEEVVHRLGIKLAIIAVPAKAAQGVCDRLVKCGIRGILNMAPTHLKAPQQVVVRDENIAMALVMVSKLVADAELQEKKECSNTDIYLSN